MKKETKANVMTADQFLLFQTSANWRNCAWNTIIFLKKSNFYLKDSYDVEIHDQNQMHLLI